MDDWYRPESFEPGEIYVDADGELTLEYAGIVTAKAARGLLAEDDQSIEVSDDTEPVMVFLVVTEDEGAVTYYTHTKADADRGYAFMSLADRRVDK
jgi:hypothetical protein